NARYPTWQSTAVWLGVLRLEAYAAFSARTDDSVDVDGTGGFWLFSLEAAPALALSSDDCFAPSALIGPRHAIAERHKFDGGALGSFSLHGQGFNKFQHAAASLATERSPCNRRQALLQLRTLFAPLCASRGPRRSIQRSDHAIACAPS